METGRAVGEDEKGGSSVIRRVEVHHYCLGEEDWVGVGWGVARKQGDDAVCHAHIEGNNAVSYTHLTLPTRRTV